MKTPVQADLFKTETAGEYPEQYSPDMIAIFEAVQKQLDHIVEIAAVNDVGKVQLMSAVISATTTVLASLIGDESTLADVYISTAEAIRPKH